jgi:hypothetical protein
MIKILILSDINWWGWGADLGALEEFIGEEQPGLIILAGDLVNSGGPLSGWRSIQKLLLFLNEHQIHTFIIRGNWDEAIQYDRLMKKVASFQNICDISNQLVNFRGINFLGVPYSTTDDLKSIRSLKNRILGPVDFVVAHAELKRRVWLFELNPKIIISGHSDVQLCQIRQTVFVSIDSFPRRYAIINYDPPVSEVIYYQDNYLLNRQIDHYFAINRKGEEHIELVDRKHVTYRVGFAEDGQLNRISKAPKHFRQAGKANYSRIIEDLLLAKERTESYPDKKADTISRLLRKGISEKWVREYLAKPRV